MKHTVLPARVINVDL